MRKLNLNPKKTSPIKKETMDMVKSVAIGKRPGKFDSVAVGKKPAPTPKKPNVKSTKAVPVASQRAKNFMKGTTGPNKITPVSKR